MHPRAARDGPTSCTATYTVDEIVALIKKQQQRYGSTELANRTSVLRLLKAAGVDLLPFGRCVRVPLSGLQAHLPAVYRELRRLPVAHVADVLAGTVTPVTRMSGVFGLSRQATHRYIETSGIATIALDGRAVGVLTTDFAGTPIWSSLFAMQAALCDEPAADPPQDASVWATMMAVQAVRNAEKPTRIRSEKARRQARTERPAAFTSISLSTYKYKRPRDHEREETRAHDCLVAAGYRQRRPSAGAPSLQAEWVQVGMTIDGKKIFGLSVSVHEPPIIRNAAVFGDNERNGVANGSRESSVDASGVGVRNAGNVRRSRRGAGRAPDLYARRPMGRRAPDGAAARPQPPPPAD